VRGASRLRAWACASERAGESSWYGPRSFGVDLWSGRKVWRMDDGIALCIEDMSEATSGVRAMRCVAVRSRQVGLGLSSRGEIVWKSPRPDVCDLCVSVDGLLVLYRPEQGPPVVVTRAGRSLDVPVGKPVLRRSGDHLRMGGRQLRVHVHGHTHEVHAPTPIHDASWGAGCEEAGCGRCGNGRSRRVQVRVLFAGGVGRTQAGCVGAVDRCAGGAAGCGAPAVAAVLVREREVGATSGMLRRVAWQSPTNRGPCFRTDPSRS